MNIKEQLCNAFCDTLSIREVPAGLAIGTGYDGLGGDPVGLFVVGPDNQGQYTVQDDGVTMPTLEAMGADLANKTRLEAFEELQRTYGVELDDETGELKATSPNELSLAPTVMRFIAFMLRIQDMAFMAVERAASTFRDDAMKELRAVIGQRAMLHENYVVADSLAEFPADVGIVVEGKPPVALFWGITEAKMLEALLLQAYASSQKVQCSVAVMLEKEKSASEKMRQRLNNHLDAVPYFRGAEREACARIARQALGYDPISTTIQ
jgi:hypothetical protein